MHGYVHGVLFSGSDCVCINLIYVLCMYGCTAGFSAEATACSFDLRACECIGYTVCFLGEATESFALCAYEHDTSSPVFDGGSSIDKNPSKRVRKSPPKSP